MKKILAFVIVLAALTSCREWDPVLIRDYGVPDDREPMMAPVNTTVAELKQMYLDAGANSIEIKSGVIIGGQVISSDQSGNVYRELYIQDASGAICVKIGKSSLYSDYHLGQWIYIDCGGLRLGAYNGLPQLGVEDESGEYETAYIDAQYLIDSHIFKGRQAAMPQPRTVTAADIAQGVKDGGFKNSIWGAYVTMSGLTYGAAKEDEGENFKRIFAILHAGDGDGNSVYLTDKTYGVTTWAMSKAKVLEHIAAGDFAEASTRDGRALVGEVYEALVANAAPVSMSQYFTLGSVTVQIHTSGHSRFADAEIPAAVLGEPDATAPDGLPIDVTGILSIHKGAAQLILNDLNGVSVQNQYP
jgi:hypothetical protein